MTPDRDLLTDIEPAFKQVILPDNSYVPVDEQGTMRLSVFCKSHREHFTVPPLLQTLHVPGGLRAHLWSVIPAFM